jgi:hypothetical protein
MSASEHKTADDGNQVLSNSKVVFLSVTLTN